MVRLAWAGAPARMHKPRARRGEDEVLDVPSLADRARLSTAGRGGWLAATLGEVMEEEEEEVGRAAAVARAAALV